MAVVQASLQQARDQLQEKEASCSVLQEQISQVSLPYSLTVYSFQYCYRLIVVWEPRSIPGLVIWSHPSLIPIGMVSSPYLLQPMTRFDMMPLPSGKQSSLMTCVYLAHWRLWHKNNTLLSKVNFVLSSVSAAPFGGQEARRFTGSFESRVGTITARQTWKGVCSGHFVPTAFALLLRGCLLQAQLYLTYYDTLHALMWCLLHVHYVYRSCCWQRLNRRESKWRNRWSSWRAIERQSKEIGGCLAMAMTRAFLNYYWG